MLSKEQISEITIASKNGLMNQFGMEARQKMYEKFISIVNPNSNDSLLDVGASTDFAVNSSNFLETSLTNLNITALGLNPLTEQWKQRFPNIPYIQGNALDLPFDDNTFDIVYSHAVLEHVGSIENQSTMIQEAIRVAKKSVWITTPNRWYPIEFHTGLPLLHWAPKTIHRKILNMLGMDFFSSEEILNLLDKKTLHSLLERIEIYKKVKSKHIYAQNFFGLPSNLLLHIRVS